MEELLPKTLLQTGISDGGIIPDRFLVRTKSIGVASSNKIIKITIRKSQILGFISIRQYNMVQLVSITSEIAGGGNGYTNKLFIKDLSGNTNKNILSAQAYTKGDNTIIEITCKNLNYATMSVMDFGLELMSVETIESSQYIEGVDTNLINGTIG